MRLSLPTSPLPNLRPASVALLAMALLPCLLISPACVSEARPADKAAIKMAAERANEYLLKILPDEKTEGRRILMAYALIKGGANKQHPEVQKVVADILKRTSGEKYVTINANVDAHYAAAIEAMILVDMGPEKYRDNLQKIVDHFVAYQRDNGSWDYPSPASQVGDTSVTQYGSLALWAGSLAGAEVPPEAWDRLLTFHFETQQQDGGFVYAIGNRTGPGFGSSTGSMTAAAIASMTIAAMFLYPDRMVELTGLSTGAAPSGGRRTEKDQFGFLKKRDPESPEAVKPRGPYVPQNSFDDYRGHLKPAVGWLTRNYVLDYKVGPQMYYYYSIERMGALTDAEAIGAHKWFEEISDRLIQKQRPDGSWDLDYLDAGDTYPVGTSFGVLFLARSTAKLLNRISPPDPIGGGIQAGGRGLPDDLSAVTMQEGRVAQEESTGPLDDLLKSLATAGGDDLFNLQTKIVKKIQLGDRSELIGQTDRLVKLLEYPNPEIRRTALWALARSDDLTLARYAVAALEDPDADVAIEAHNSLCWLSRRPNAFDIPDTPFEKLPPDATDEQKVQAFQKWQQFALQKWGQWYLRMVPYEDRNDPFALDLATKIGRR